MEKLKVLHIIEALGGGVYSYFTDLSHVMGRDDRLEVFIAYSNKRKEINPDDVAKDFHPNCKLILLDLVKEINPLKDFQGYLEVKRCIKIVQPDAVHLHSSKAGILGRLAMRSFKNIPSFYTPHGYAFLRKDVSNKKRKFFKILEKNFARFSKTKTIACGDTEFEMASDIDQGAILIRNGVDVKSLSQKYSPKQNIQPIVAIVGRITYARDPALFDKIALSLPEIQFKWIGDGELRELITAPNIEVSGWFTQRSKALEEMSQIDIYLQTSLWEGLPIALLEAMALKKPIVATNIVGNKDLVVHGETGYLFTSEIEAVESISALLDRDMRIQFGNKAFNRVNQLFNVQKNFKSMADHYLACCNKTS